MYQRTLTDHFHTWCQYLNNFVISYSYYIHIYVVVNFFFISLQFFFGGGGGGGGIVMYANKLETKGKEILQILNKLQHISD